MPSLIKGIGTKSHSMMGDDTLVWEAVCPSRLRLVLECVPGEDVMYVVAGPGPALPHEVQGEVEGSRGFGRDLCEAIREVLVGVPADRPDLYMTVFANHPQFAGRLGVTEHVVIMNDIPKGRTVDQIYEAIGEIWRELDGFNLVPPYGEFPSATLSVDSTLLYELLLAYAGEVNGCGLCPMIHSCRLPDRMVSKVDPTDCADMLLAALTGDKGTS